MLKKCDRNMFIANLNSGDCGLILSDNFFSTMQDWLRIKEKDSKRASHAFMITYPPALAEANGLRSSNGTIYKYVGDTTKCWIFRYENIKPNQVDGIIDYCRGVVEGGSTYNVMGIVQFGLYYLGVKHKISAESGLFCSELDVLSLRSQNIPVCGDVPAYQVTPSNLLTWLSSNDASTKSWILSGMWDGTDYWIEVNYA